MQTLTSADGTTIAYDCSGTGQPLICLHGSGVTRQVWDGVADALAADATVVVPDRRGRGDSSDGESYAFTREIEDVEALVETIEKTETTANATGGQTTNDSRPVLFGSSFGGLLAMRAADIVSVDRLVLYEPPVPAAGVDPDDRTSLAARLESLLGEGRREDAVKLFFTEATGADSSMVEHWPIWPDCVELAETIVREAHVVESFHPEDVQVSVPTLLLTGGRSPAYLREGVEVLAEWIPDSQVVEIEGAGHAGVVTAPEEVAVAVRGFL